MIPTGTPGPGGASDNRFQGQCHCFVYQESKILWNARPLQSLWISSSVGSLSNLLFRIPNIPEPQRFIENLMWQNNRTENELCLMGLLWIIGNIFPMLFQRGRRRLYTSVVLAPLFSGESWQVCAVHKFHSPRVWFEKRRRRGVAQPQRSQHAQDLKIEDGTGTLSTEALGVMQKSQGTECEERKGGCHEQWVC